MVIGKDYYIIMFLDNLTYHTGDGVPDTSITMAEEFYTKEQAQKELETLDEEYREVAAIYSVHEGRTYDLQKLDK